MAGLLALEDYGIDRKNGFVAASDPLRRLPETYAAWDEIAADLPTFIRGRRLRDKLAALPLLDPLTLTTEAERERALLLLTVFANGWVWSGAEPHLTLPPTVAVPLCALADEMGRPAIVHYGSMALWNWRRVDTNRPVSADNADMLVSFLGGVDESWFFIASLGVELAGAPLLSLVHRAVAASRDATDTELSNLLDAIAETTRPVQTATERMYEWCDPYIFYHRVRPFVAGWPAPGLVYDGVSAEPRTLIGGSAAQSSLIQSLDALVSVDHPSASAGAYLQKMRSYMPPKHQNFVNDVARLSNVRARAEAGAKRLEDAYNAVIREIGVFRSKHIKLAHDYIAVPSGMAAREKGTGGTDFVDFLQAVRDTTMSRKL